MSVIWSQWCFVVEACPEQHHFLCKLPGLRSSCSSCGHFDRPLPALSHQAVIAPVSVPKPRPSQVRTQPVLSPSTLPLAVSESSQSSDCHPAWDNSSSSALLVRSHILLFQALVQATFTPFFTVTLYSVPQITGIQGFPNMLWFFWLKSLLTWLFLKSCFLLKNPTNNWMWKSSHWHSKEKKNGKIANLHWFKYARSKFIAFHYETFHLTLI